MPHVTQYHTLPLRIPDLVKSKYASSHSVQLKELESKFEKDKKILAAVSGSVEESRVVADA